MNSAAFLGNVGMIENRPVCFVGRSLTVFLLIIV